MKDQDPSSGQNELFDLTWSPLSHPLGLVFSTLISWTYKFHFCSFIDKYRESVSDSEREGFSSKLQEVEHWLYEVERTNVKEFTWQSQISSKRYLVFLLHMHVSTQVVVFFPMKSSQVHLYTLSDKFARWSSWGALRGVFGERTFAPPAALLHY